MDVEKTTEFLLANQARHDTRIAQIREQHQAEMAEIRTIQKATQEMLSETVQLVGNLYRVAERHQ